MCYGHAWMDVKGRRKRGKKVKVWQSCVRTRPKWRPSATTVHNYYTYTQKYTKAKEKKNWLSLPNLKRKKVPRPKRREPARVILHPLDCGTTASKEKSLWWKERARREQLLESSREYGTELTSKNLTENEKWCESSFFFHFDDVDIGSDAWAVTVI